MKPHGTEGAAVRSAIRRGLKSIRDNPGAETQRIAELAAMFGSGDPQSSLFDRVRELLTDEDGAYGALVSRTVRNTDTELLTNLVMNLGYHSLSHGARQIRVLEENLGFNIPWTIVFDMGYGDYLELPLINDLIRQGRELGIHCCMFYVDSAYPSLSGLFAVLGTRDDCVFPLFLHPCSVNSAVAEEIRRAGNIFALLDAEDDRAAAASAAGLLRSKECPYGVFVRYDCVPDAQALALAEALEAAVCVFVRTQQYCAADGKGACVSEMRETLSRAVFPVDLYEDIARIDRRISSDACLTVVLGDGSMHVVDMDSGESFKVFHVEEFTLTDILGRTMPKTRPPAQGPQRA